MDTLSNAHQYGDLSYPDDMLSIIQNGLPKSNDPKKISIIGAGMAGLVAASLLTNAGHQVTIIEGNDRIGGRIYTVRKPFTPGNYLDMGAMRFPETHELVKAYVQKFQLPTNPFFNTSPKDILFVNGVLTTAEYYEKNPDVLQFPLLPNEKGKTARDLLLNAVQPFLTLYNNSNDQEQEQLRGRFDRYSFDEFLRDNPFGESLSTDAIRMIKVVLGIEGFPEYSFIDILLDIVSTVFNPELTYYEITGGNDLLPKSLFKELKNQVVFNQYVTKLYQKDESVVVTTLDQLSGHCHVFEADYTIVTVPYSVFQFIDVYPYQSISYDKWKVIRELNFVPSVKIGLEFRTKFWENEEIGNIITDFPLRFTYNPSHDIGEKGPGVMLASYSWGHNAMLWSSLGEEGRIREALDGLFKIYGPQVYNEFLQGATFSWSQNKFSAGCFTLFTPNQASDFDKAIYLPESRLHFAGEHTSTFHGWVEGAIESGIRTAWEVHFRDD